jgi:5'-3' exoribonuclease 1
MGVPKFFLSLLAKYKKSNFVFSKQSLSFEIERLRNAVVEKEKLASNAKKKLDDFTQTHSLKDYDNSPKNSELRKTFDKLSEGLGAIDMSYENEMLEEYVSTHQSVERVDNLYLDANCRIHPTCFRVASLNKHLIGTNTEVLEKLMIKQIIIDIQMIIDAVNPRKMIYIAIDGVAPVAKMKHQRMRRFKSVIDNELKRDLHEKNGLEYVPSWNNSAITPGTKFMEKLTKAIYIYFDTKQKLRDSTDEHIDIIFSSSGTVGEGEHKIMQHIKEEQTSDETVRMIYGLDADLLYLAMATFKDYIYLLREITEFQDLVSENEFCMVSIDVLKNTVCDSINNAFEHPLINNNLIQDYIFMGFLLGNDFLPSLPSVNLSYHKKGMSGLDVLMDTYIEVQMESETVHNYIAGKMGSDLSISYVAFLLMFEKLDMQEEGYFIEKSKQRKFIRPFQPSEKATGNKQLTSYEYQMHQHENLNFHIPDLFKFGKQYMNKSKQAYYEYYFDMKITTVEQIVEQYIIGIVWNMHYYLNKCVQYHWFYPYHKAPFVSDIYSWLLVNNKKFHTILYSFPPIYDYNKTIYPLEQLFMVLPIQSCYLLPDSIQHVMYSNPSLFPEIVEQDFQNITKSWQATPIIDVITPAQKTELLNDIELTPVDGERNLLVHPYTFKI